MKHDAPQLNFVFNLADFSPELDHDGNLTIALPVEACPVFDPAIVAQLNETMGQRKADQILDDAANMIHRAIVVHHLASKMR